MYKFLWPLRWGGCSLVVYIRRFIYKFLNVCPFDYKAVAASGMVGLLMVYHTSWVAVVTPTDRPKSVRNRSVIELFCGVVCVVALPIWHFCWCRGFCHRTESDLFLFLLYYTSFCRSILCYVLGRCVKDFYGKKEDIFKLFLYSVSYKFYNSQFWQLVY